jgi:hypothetical protein
MEEDITLSDIQHSDKDSGLDTDTYKSSPTRRYSQADHLVHPSLASSGDSMVNFHADSGNQLEVEILGVRPPCYGKEASQDKPGPKSSYQTTQQHHRKPTVVLRNISISSDITLFMDRPLNRPGIVDLKSKAIHKVISRKLKLFGRRFAKGSRNVQTLAVL